MKKITILFVLFLGISKGQAQNSKVTWKEIVNSKDEAWFQSKEAQEIGENVLLYQRNIGAWPKNIQMQEPLSAKQKADLLALKPSTKECTIDNGATTMEMLFLSKIYKHNPQEKHKTAFLKGLDYLLLAQYENGGWPQFYPLEKKYSSHITYNDDAMVNVLKVLKEINEQTDFYSIKPSEEIRQKSISAFNKGIDCILKTQYKQNGVLTAWCAQHDEFTLQPADARSFELKSLSGHESAGIVSLLMSIKNPSKEIITAVNNAVTWFEKTKITNLKEVKVYDENGKQIDRKMVLSKNEKPIWARFMELENNKPFFCDRDGIKKDSLSQIGHERRNGYAWYVNSPEKVIVKFATWRKENKMPTPKDPNKITVALDGSADFTSIQEAINQSHAYPYEPIVIFIKNGIYNEKIKVHEWNTNLHLIGESKENTIITFNDHFDKIGVGRNSTFYTYTMLVEANDILLKNLTIENSSGQVRQAIALSVTSTHVAVVNCKLLGHQDTLYASGIGKQYYKDCYIDGTTDFIFGSATAYFENCEIHSKSDSFVTASSTPKGTEFGFVFNNCKLTSEDSISKVYLGRPWRFYGKTVFMNSNLGKHILPEGWNNWSKPEAEKGTFYAEFQNNGEGSKTDSRVKWSHQLAKKEAKKYTIKNILGENNPDVKIQWYENL